MFFHFTKLSTCIEKILPKKKLKLCSILNTNDPRETYAWGFGGKNVRENDDENLIEKSYLIGEQIRKNIKILCLNGETNGYENMMMWAHYSNNHRGICLGLSREKFFEENQDELAKYANVFHDSVNYETTEIGLPSFNRGINQTTEDAINFLITNQYKRLFFTKSTYWEKEQEYRIVIKGNYDNDIFLNIENSLQKIYLGVYFPVQYLPSIEEQINTVNVKIYSTYFEGNKIKFMNHSIGDYRPLI